MYEFCHQYKNIENGIFNYSIEKLRVRFNIQNKYLSNEIFKFKILEQSKKELQEKASIYFNYRFLKNKVTGKYFLKFKIFIDPRKNESNKLAQENYTKVYTFLNQIYGGTIDSVKLADQIYNNKYIGVAKTRFESLNNDL
jgi:plasmid replication initiation protein